MRFNEKSAITVKRYDNVFIYFLLKKKQVVYVGQTRVGLARPLAHKNKDYDEIKLLYCKEEKLDFLENKYIMKYDPIYNKIPNLHYNFSLHEVKKKLYEDLGKKIENYFLKEKNYG